MYPQVQSLPLPNGDVFFYPRFLSAVDSDRYLDTFQREVEWQQDVIHLYGRSLPLPRLTAWYGDLGASYTYSGIEMQPRPWSQPLLALKAKIQAAIAVPFNSVLLNLYRHGQDSIAWHSDDEPELGENPIIVSVSLGATRRFSLKHKYRKDLQPIHLELTHGSLLLMQGETQAHWLHQVPKTNQPVNPRINLTFRMIEHDAAVIGHF